MKHLRIVALALVTLIGVTFFGVQPLWLVWPALASAGPPQNVVGLWSGPTQPSTGTANGNMWLDTSVFPSTLKIQQASGIWLPVSGAGTVYKVGTGGFTTANNTNLQTITGLSWTSEASNAHNWTISCHLAYSSAVGIAAVSFGVQSVTVAPTNGFFVGTLYTSATALTAGNLPALNSTTATVIVTGTPSAITTVWNAELYGYLEQPSNASASVINIMVKTEVAADTVNIKRGSYCVVI